MAIITEPYYVADSNMPNSWWDFLGPNRVNDPTLASVVFHTDAFIGPVDHHNSIAILIESQAIHPHAYNAIQRYHTGYKKILTFDKETLKLPNSQLCYFGGGWVQTEDWKIYPKTADLCMTLSGKRFTDGHRMRHDVYEKVQGRLNAAHGYMNPIPNTLTGLKDWRFNICVENTRCDYYFSEKILDCFCTGTIPVYCGCPSIGELFDIQGILVFSTLEELEIQLSRCNEQTYDELRPHVEENLLRTKEYWSYERNIERALQESEVSTANAL